MDLKNKHFLIVDDDEIIIDTLKEQIEIFEGKVDFALNGNDAFELIKKNKYNLVISDVRMPECSGLDLLKKVRDYDGKTPEIILISAFTDISNEKAQHLGAKGLFLKPEVMSNILEVIKNYC